MVDADFNFKMPKIEMTDVSEDGKYGRFVVEPLERGYGLTLGNSLRRIMLSSLVGTAVSSVKIEGVLHEFSSIPGVKEDVTEIIMNIKQLAIKNNSSSVEPKEAHIDFVGEGVVKASDIQVDPDIEIINPDLVIAHLNGADCKLSMELTITNGRGYVSSEKNKKEDKKYLTQNLSKYNKREQKLISKVYSILQAILPKDMADMVVAKIQEELSK